MFIWIQIILFGFTINLNHIQQDKSCSQIIERELIHGTYEGAFDVYYDKLILRKNKSFKFKHEWFEGGSSIETGQWKLSNDTLELQVDTPKLKTYQFLIIDKNICEIKGAYCFEKK